MLDLAVGATIDYSTVLGIHSFNSTILHSTFYSLYTHTCRWRSKAMTSSASSGFTLSLQQSKSQESRQASLIVKMTSLMMPLISHFVDQNITRRMSINWTPMTQHAADSSISPVSSWIPASSSLSPPRIRFVFD